jgi:hypothetical protein
MRRAFLRKYSASVRIFWASSADGVLDRSERRQQLFDLAVIEQVLVDHHPTVLLDLIIGVQFAS